MKGGRKSRLLVRSSQVTRLQVLYTFTKNIENVRKDTNGNVIKCVKKVKSSVRQHAKVGNSFFFLVHGNIKIPLLRMNEGISLLFMKMSHRTILYVNIGSASCKSLLFYSSSVVDGNA